MMQPTAMVNGEGDLTFFFPLPFLLEYVP